MYKLKKYLALLLVLVMSVPLYAGSTTIGTGREGRYGDVLGKTNGGGGIANDPVIFIYLDTGGYDLDIQLSKTDQPEEAEIFTNKQYSRHAPSISSLKGGLVMPTTSAVWNNPAVTAMCDTDGTILLDEGKLYRQIKTQPQGANYNSSHVYVRSMYPLVKDTRKKTVASVFGNGKWKNYLSKASQAETDKMWSWITADKGVHAAQRLQLYAKPPASNTLPTVAAGDPEIQEIYLKSKDPLAVLTEEEKVKLELIMQNINKVTQLCYIDTLMCLYQSATADYKPYVAKRIDMYINDCVAETSQANKHPTRIIVEAGCRVSSQNLENKMIFHYISCIDYQQFIYTATQVGMARSYNPEDAAIGAISTKEYTSILDMFEDSYKKSYQINSRQRMTDVPVNQNNGFSWGQSGNTGFIMHTKAGKVTWSARQSSGLINVVRFNENISGYAVVVPFHKNETMPAVAPRQDIEADKPDPEEVPMQSDVIHKDTLVTLEARQESDAIKSSIISQVDAATNVSMSVEIRRTEPTTTLADTDGTLTANDSITGDGTKYTMSKEEVKDFISGTKMYTWLDHTKGTPIADDGSITYKYSSNVILYLDDDEIEFIRDDGLATKTYFKQKAPTRSENSYTSVPQTWSEIKEGSPENETWEAMAGVPTTERLYFASGGSEFAVDINLRYVESECALRSYTSYFSSTDCRLNGSIECNGHHGCTGCATGTNPDGSTFTFCANPCSSSLHMPCHPHTVGGYSENWSTTSTFDYIEILGVDVWKLSKSKVDGMSEILEDASDTVEATILQGDPTVFYHIASSNTASGGRLLYSLEPEQNDSVVWYEGSSDDECNNSPDDGPVIETKVFEQRKKQTNSVTMVSDALILQTSSGDQAIVNFNRTSETRYCTEDLTLSPVGISAAWTWSKDPYGIHKGSYNGKFSTPTEKYSKYSGSHVSNPLDGYSGRVRTPGTVNGAYVDKTRSNRPDAAMRLYQDDLAMPLTLRNGEYITGRATAFFELIVSYGDITSRYSTDVDPVFGKPGFRLDSNYSDDHTKVNDIVVHDPVSAQYAMIVPLPDERDQRTTASTIDIPHELVYTEGKKVLDCKYTGSTSHDEKCFLAYQAHSAFNAHQHTADCYATETNYLCQEEYNTVYEIYQQPIDVDTWLYHWDEDGYHKDGDGHYWRDIKYLRAKPVRYCNECHSEITDLSHISSTNKYICQSCYQYVLTHQELQIFDRFGDMEQQYDGAVADCPIPEAIHMHTSTCATRWVAGDLICNNEPLNKHICTDDCKETTKLVCKEPHHIGEHYDSCWKIVYEDVPIGKEVEIPEHGTYASGNFINLDYEFDVYFPNIGDFYGNEAWGIGQTTEITGKSFIDEMDVTKWTKEKYAVFDYDVIYNDQMYLAGEKVYFPVEESYFTLYCPLENREAVGANVHFVSIAINNEESEDDSDFYTNKGRKTGTLAANHSASKHYFIDVVGRIGNLTIEDTQDFRYSNFFKDAENPLSWIIKGLLYRVDLSKTRNIYSDIYDIRGVLSSPDTKYTNTYGTLSPHERIGATFPLTPNKNVLNDDDHYGANELYNKVMSKEALRIGYYLFNDISTIGNYGKGVLQIIPYYYILDLNTGEITPADAYVQVSSGNYVPINLFNNCKPGWNKNTVYNQQIALDWEAEAARRNYTTEEKTFTEKMHELHTILQSDGTTKPLSIPNGNYFILGNHQLMQLTGRARTFIGDNYTYGKDTNPGERCNTGDYVFHGQRWHFKTGLPSSTVIVKQGDPVTTETIQNMADKSKMLIMAANIKAIGDVYTLSYSSPGLDLSKVDIFDKTYDLTPIIDGTFDNVVPTVTDFIADDPDDPGTGGGDPDDPGTGGGDPDDPDDPGTGGGDPDDPGTGGGDPDDPDDPGTGGGDPDDPDDPGTGGGDPDDPDDPGTGGGDPDDPDNPDDPGTGEDKPEGKVIITIVPLEDSAQDDLTTAGVY